MNIKEVKAGDIFSEVSHYVATKDYNENSESVSLIHIESKKEVLLSNKYVENLLKTADSFSKIVEVGKEDKLWTAKQIDEQFANLGKLSENAPRVGDIRVKGIRTIWEELVSPHVFTVCFQKADKAKTQKALKAEKEARIQSYVDQIERVKIQKKGVAVAAAVIVEDSISNPILTFEPGEDRILRGFKVQFTSRDGKYDCVDMNILTQGTESAVRPVNINTIKYLIFDDVMYQVK